MNDGIRYDESLPKEFVPIVQKFFDAEQWLIPGWVQGVTVRYRDASDIPGGCLEVSANYAYRWVYITVLPGFFNEADHIRREFVIHEMVHISLEPLLEFCKDTLRQVLQSDAPKFHAVVEKQLVERAEMAVQDLAYLIRHKTAKEG